MAIELAMRVSAAGVLMFGAIDPVPLTARRLFPWAPTSFLMRTGLDGLAKVKALGVPSSWCMRSTTSSCRCQRLAQMFQEIRAPEADDCNVRRTRRVGFAFATQLEAPLATYWPPNWSESGGTDHTRAARGVGRRKPGSESSPGDDIFSCRHICQEDACLYDLLGQLHQSTRFGNEEPSALSPTLIWRCRGVAQPGRASGSGPEGRWFESSRPDHYSKNSLDPTRLEGDIPPPIQARKTMHSTS